MRVAAFLLSAALIVFAVACAERPPLPPLDARARVVPVAMGGPNQCDHDESPRDPTDVERRMRGSLSLASGERDLVACRALCRRAVRPGETVVDCFHARSDVTVGCVTQACAERHDLRVKRAMFCGESGARAAADPAAAQAAIPYIIQEGDEVVVCTLR